MTRATAARAGRVKKVAARPDGAPLLSKRVLSIEVSPTIAAAGRASALRAAGRDVLDFSVGEPDQPTEERVRRAASDAMNRGETRYIPSLGIPPLRQAVANRYAQDLGVRFTPSQVAITQGGKQAYALACEAILNPGDEIVIPSPYWPTFAEAPRIVGGKPVIVPLDPKKGFAFEPKPILSALTSKTRAVVINSPSNPTGAVISDTALIEIARGVLKHGASYLIYDDTYARLLFVESSRRALGQAKEILGDRLIIPGTASKTYCMTGWRIGWLLGSEDLVRGAAALISHETQCTNSFAQWGAVEALSGSQDFVGVLADEYRARRDLVVEALRAMPGIQCHAPQGAFYAFADVRAVLSAGIPNALTLCQKLLDEEGVALVAGEGFSCPGFVRLSFARSREELRQGLDRIASFLARHTKRSPSLSRAQPVERQR